jgi:cytochrome c oxidase subunit 1
LLGSAYFGWDGGWTVYPPLSTVGSPGFQFVFLAIFFLGFSSILGSLNLIATILLMRPPGMSLFRMPIFCWAVLATSFLQLTATQFSYRWIALSSVGIALIGFIVWGHHMFTSGYAPNLRIWFMLSTLLVAVPTGVKFFSWLGTLWGGKLEFPTPMLFVLGAISVFLIGGLSGPILATVASDLPLHDSYFVVGHFHGTIFGGFIFPFFAAIYYWFPKITGRMYNEVLGKLHFWIMMPAFWFQSIGQMTVGTMGMRRRIADYEQGLAWMINPNLGAIEVGHMIITIAAFAIAFGVLLMIYNLFNSAEVGVAAGANPWRSRSPEWQIPSPVPEHSFASPIRVVGEPYDYGLPGSYVAAGAPAGDD